MMTQVKTDTEITAMRESGHMLATVLEYLKTHITTGMTSKDLAELAKQELRKLGGQPTFLGYYGFPDVLCVSINDEVVHGIPRYNRIIQDGDLVSLDFGVTYKGMITDSATSLIIGKGTPAAQKLLKATKLSLEAGVNAVRADCHVGDISAAIQAILDRAGYGIVHDLVGHGVGHELHEDPNVPNYGKAGAGEKLSAGMTIAIEPMATLGDYHVKTDSDNWTIRTVDGSLAAHFEHTVLITRGGPEILTLL